MILTLQNEQKLHLSYLVKCSAKDFDNVLKNIKLGKTLITNEEPETELLQASQALLKLLLDAKNINLSEKDFLNQLKAQTEFPDSKIELLGRFLCEAEILDELITSDEFRFKDIEWRLEAKIASRYSHSLPADPKITVKFHLDKEKSLKHRLTLTEAKHDVFKKEIVVVTDANSLSQIIDQLEQARTSVNVKRAN